MDRTNSKGMARQTLVAYKSRLLDNLIKEKKFPSNAEKFWAKFKDYLTEYMRILKEKWVYKAKRS